MQHPAIGHDDAKSAVTFREMRIKTILPSRKATRDYLNQGETDAEN